MQILVVELHQQPVGRVKLAAAVIPGPECLVAELQVADLVLGDVQVEEVVLIPRQGPALEDHGRGIIERLGQIQSLNAPEAFFVQLKAFLESGAVAALQVVARGEVDVVLVGRLLGLVGLGAEVARQA